MQKQRNSLFALHVPPQPALSLLISSQVVAAAAAAEAVMALPCPLSIRAALGLRQGRSRAARVAQHELRVDRARRALDGVHTSAKKQTYLRGCTAAATLVLSMRGRSGRGAPLPTALPTTNTTSIDYNEQDYTGTIPTEFGLLTAATSLDLGKNTLTGTMPTELGLLTATSSFSVLYNSLSGTLPTELGKAVEMSAGFWAYRNSLSGSVPTQLGNWVQLTQNFQLSYYQGLSNLFSSTLPTELGRLSKLTSCFMVQQNKVSGAIPTQLGNLNSMRHQLRLDMNEFSSALPSELGRLTGITYGMQLYSNDVCGDVPTGASRRRLARGLLLPLRFVAAGPHVASHSASPAHPTTVPPTCRAPGAFKQRDQLLESDHRQRKPWDRLRVGRGRSLPWTGEYDHHER